VLVLTEIARRAGGALETATAALCAEMVGGMQWVLDTTVEFAKTRQSRSAYRCFPGRSASVRDMLLMN